MSVAEPSVNDLNPVAPAGQELEPVILLDTSGSMSWGATAAGDHPSRWEIVTEAMGGIVAGLEGKDSQAAREAAAGEDKGGLLAHRFAADTSEIGDLTSANWKGLLMPNGNEMGLLGGGTVITPGWNAVLEAYMEEFGTQSPMDRPQLACVIVTDGEAHDPDDFKAAMEGVKNKAYVIIVVVGFGDDHDKALAQYQGIAAINDHVRVVTFDSVTNPSVISDGILSMLGAQ